MKTQPHPITLAVLAGGEGARMGFPKAQIRIGGEPILRHLMRRIAWPSATMLVTAPGRTQPDGADCFDREVIDPIAGQGPLRGLLTALENLQTDQLIVATVDMPAITNQQFAFLIDELDAAGTAAADAVMLAREGGLEPFPSIYRPRAAELVRALLASSERSMRSLARYERVRVVPAPRDWPSSVWTNLNVPADLQDTTHPQWRNQSLH